MKLLFNFILAILLNATAPLFAHAAQLASINATKSGKATFDLSGWVLSNKGTPLPGAVVAVKGVGNPSTTNSAGGFLLKVEESATVQVTCQGYQSQTLTATPTSDLVITLYPIGVAPPLVARADEASNNPSLTVTDVQPTYPGGVGAYREYLKQNAHYPDKARESNKSGEVFVSFMVDELGRILDAQVVKGVGYGLDEEALRLVRLMPWWNPGLIAGKPVKVTCTLRIKFGVEQPIKPVTAY